jgi:hypothetical protein
VKPAQGPLVTLTPDRCGTLTDSVGYDPVYGTAVEADGAEHLQDPLAELLILSGAVADGAAMSMVMVGWHHAGKKNKRRASGGQVQAKPA